ncbi:hypothetical protein TYRP_020572 [Tyrophagus putrescentiae]|nr:hypothetical protein TYRP_020572 [Tyrophagus putrescentiae]
MIGDWGFSSDSVLFFPKTDRRPEEQVHLTCCFIYLTIHLNSLSSHPNSNINNNNINTSSIDFLLFLLLLIIIIINPYQLKKRTLTQSVDLQAVHAGLKDGRQGRSAKGVQLLDHPLQVPVHAQLAVGEGVAVEPVDEELLAQLRLQQVVLEPPKLGRLSVGVDDLPETVQLSPLQVAADLLQLPEHLVTVDQHGNGCLYGGAHHRSLLIDRGQVEVEGSL